MFAMITIKIYVSLKDLLSIESIVIQKKKKLKLLINLSCISLDPVQELFFNWISNERTNDPGGVFCCFTTWIISLSLFFLLFYIQIDL